MSTERFKGKTETLKLGIEGSGKKLASLNQLPYLLFQELIADTPSCRKQCTGIGRSSGFNFLSGLAGKPYVVANLFSFLATSVLEKGSFCVPSETEFARNGEYSAELFGFRITMSALLYIVLSVIEFLPAHCIWNGETLHLDQPYFATKDNGGITRGKVCHYSIAISKDFIMTLKRIADHVNGVVPLSKGSLHKKVLLPTSCETKSDLYFESLLAITFTGAIAANLKCRWRLEEALLAMKDVNLIMRTDDIYGSKEHNKVSAVDLQRSTREDGRRDLLDFGHCCSGNDCMAVTRSERRYWLAKR
ncbi:hypothetical protein Tco_0479315 [Tanacetum coccineum]